MVVKKEVKKEPIVKVEKKKEILPDPNGELAMKSCVDGIGKA